MKTENKDKVLYYLEELSDYKVADSDKDVRGWDVNDADGKTIGEVDNLLVNKNTERVVYLDVKVDESIISADYKPYTSKVKDGVHDFLNEDGENHVIIPIGMATLDLDVVDSYTRPDAGTNYPDDDTFYDRDEFNRRL